MERLHECSSVTWFRVTCRHDACSSTVFSRIFYANIWIHRRAICNGINPYGIVSLMFGNYGDSTNYLLKVYVLFVYYCTKRMFEVIFEDRLLFEKKVDYLSIIKGEWLPMLRETSRFLNFTSLFFVVLWYSFSYCSF